MGRRLLTPEDFQPRDWVPFSGWPIGYHDLEPYYRQTGSVAGIGGEPGLRAWVTSLRR